MPLYGSIFFVESLMYEISASRLLILETPFETLFCIVSMAAARLVNSLVILATRSLHRYN